VGYNRLIWPQPSCLITGSPTQNIYKQTIKVLHIFSILLHPIKPHTTTKMNDNIKPHTTTKMRASPPKIGKKMIFWRNFFKCAPLTWNPGSAPALYMILLISCLYYIHWVITNVDIIETYRKYHMVTCHFQYHTFINRSIEDLYWRFGLIKVWYWKKSCHIQFYRCPKTDEDTCRGHWYRYYHG
jgi:glycosyltransferase involved in cell wall biosynthesis